MKLNVKAFAITCALVVGFAVLFITWWKILLDGANCNPTVIGKIYRGYNLSIGGSFIGFIWGFFDGLIGGAVFASLYNFLASKFDKK